MTHDIREIKVCNICDDFFLSQRKTKFCSRKCADKNQKLIKLGHKNPMFNKKVSITTRDKISLALKGHIVSKETRKKIKEVNIKTYSNQLIRDKISKKNSGRKLSLKHRKKLSIAKKGHQLTEEHKKKLLEANLGRKCTEEQKLVFREKAIDYIKKCKGKISPRIGLNEKEILDNVEKNNNIELTRQHRVIGYFVDGYDKENNVVYEVNELHHFKNNKYTKKHIDRKNNIIKALKCKWVDIDDKTKIRSNIQE